MNIGLAKRIFLLGLLNIWRHRLRSTLTILGIVFGVCSVIAMLAIGEGASYEAQEQIKKLGSQNIIINSVKPPESESVTTETDRMIEYGLTYKDAERIRDTIPSVQVLVPSRSIRGDISYRRKKVDAQIFGTVPWYPEIANQRVRLGRFVTNREMDDSKNVCVLSDALAKRLFTFEDPRGRVIRVRGDYYTVVGVMEEGTPSGSSSSDQSAALAVFIPLTAAKSRFGEIIVTQTSGASSMEKVELHQLIVKVASLEDVVPTSQIIGDVLKRSHRKQDYEIVVPLELLRQAERTKRIFNIVLGS
ncbi:MAG TPA: ABC transporter ATP-binding protein, partial [Firmicutes bacterium]|nr:ABC transporter ATP-binding protein [Bacillota bacterium]